MSAPGLYGLDRNAVVAASAGTGKTQFITSIYIAHTLGLGRPGRLSPERIVATTFSRLAAQEIRDRLERRLGALAEDLAAGSVALLDPALQERAAELRLAPRELASRAAAAITELPRTLIDTLHGLSARVIRSIALEIGLGPSFTILDEQLGLEDAETAIEDVLSHALEEGPRTNETVVRLIDAAGGLDATRAALVGFLSVLDEEGLDADALESFDPRADSHALLALFSTAARALLEGGVEPELVRAARSGIAALGRTPVDIDALESAFAELVDLKAPKLAKLPGGRAFQSALDGFLRGKSKRDRLRSTALFLRYADGLAEESRAIAALIGNVQRTLRARRKRRGALGFGDLLRIARDSLRDRPELAARAASEIDLLLVDEFQDTSRVQRDLILLLRERPQSRAGRAPGSLPAPEAIQPEGLVVVGDRKQSIYAFRGADVAIYAELLAELAGEPAARALDLRGVRTSANPVADFVPLTRNYRSGANILGFVNALARLDFSDNPVEPFEIKYSDAEALIPAPGAIAGSVTLLMDDGGVPENVDPIVAAAEGPLRTAFVVAGFCARVQAAGTPLADIAILARRRSSLPMIELALDRLGVPFVVSGRALYATPEVRDLAALLRVAQDPYNRHALAAVARSPLGGLSDRALAELSRIENGLPRAAHWDLLDVSDPVQRERASELVVRLRELEITLPLLSPRDALACAVERFELENVLAALPRGAVRFGNVGRLLEIAARHGGSLPMFTRWLDRQIALDTDESEAAVFSKDDDAVRLLTIHASKGLSFPVVVVVDVGGAEQPRSFPLAILRSAGRSPELVVRHRSIDGAVETPLAARARQDAQARARAERQRLSYVALTRAERQLVIAVPPEFRPGSLGASLERLLTAESFSDFELEKLSARELLATPPAPRAGAFFAVPPPAKPRSPHIESVAIGVTALADFALCPRRFSLLHVVGVGEPGSAIARPEHTGDDARALGSAAHRVLERFPVERFGEVIPVEEVVEQLAREGLDGQAEVTLATANGIRRFLGSNYARAVKDGGATLHRELELGLVLPFTEPKARPSAQLDLFQAAAPLHRAVVKATLDLVVEYPDGRLDVIDYKRSKGGDESRYAMQLFTYGEAVRSAFSAKNVRAGLVHLLADSVEPEWLAPEACDLSALVTRLVDHRYRSDYPPVLPDRCRSARCGFFPACYPARKQR